jgi:hypothetical protein
MSPAPTPRDLLKMNGIRGHGRPRPKQGVVMLRNDTPVNRAQRRFVAHVQRRQQTKTARE